MTERDLTSLKDLTVPAASADAKRKALAAALEAFDAATSTATACADTAPGRDETVAPDDRNVTQGSGTAGRPISASHGAMRRRFMTFTRTHYMMAASVAALVVAAPLAFQMTRGSFAPAEIASSLSGSYGESAKPAVIAHLDDKLVPPQPSGDGTLAKSKDTAAAEKSAKLDEARKAERRASETEPAPTDADTSLADTRIAPPFAVDTKDMAMRGDDPGQWHGGPPREGGLMEGPRPNLGNLDGQIGSGTSKTLGSAPAATPPAPPVVTAEPQAPAIGRIVAGTPQDKLGDVSVASAEPPAKPAAPVAGLGAADLNAATGGRMLNEQSRIAGTDARNRSESIAPGYNPYAQMDEAERQKQIVEQEFHDKFEAKEQSPIKQVAAEPVSTFSTDVDTASYAFVRRALNEGRLPPKDAVRVEELINYFPYAYPRPESAETPFQPTVTVMPSPWNPANQLVHIGIKGYDVTPVERPRANLVFLIDVSGSMTPPDKLPLVKNAFRMLLDELKADDTVAIVTYASGSGVALEPTRVSDKARIRAAIDKLGAGGSTAGAEGIQDAYRLAEENFDKAAVNRVILATDGDFNVGVTNEDELKGLIERKREKGIFLSVLGVGEGNYNDALMQTLAQHGNGTAAYVDTLNEARKVLVDEASSTLFTIAKDVKVQIEWNPARVSEYRLIGYETRALRREDFNNDRVDAGDIGSGHTVTAIYEVTPVGAQPMVDELRYGNGQRTAAAIEPKPQGLTTASDATDRELAFLKLRYKLPKEDASKLVSLPITAPLGESRAPAAWNEARFSVAVAAFGQLLKGSPYLKNYTYDDVLELARATKGDDPYGYRGEFLNLVRLAKSARP